MRKIVTILFLTLIVSTSFISCRFSRPFLSKRIKVDTTISYDTIEIKQTYDYFRISRYGLEGAFYCTKYFVDNNVLVHIIKDKWSTNRGVMDGRQKHKREYLKYKNCKVYEKGKHIYKIHGIGGRLRLSKTFMYDDNGKLIKKLNYKKDKK
jgi:hypothetical protein